MRRNLPAFLISILCVFAVVFSACDSGGGGGSSSASLKIPLPGGDRAATSFVRADTSYFKVSISSSKYEASKTGNLGGYVEFSSIPVGDYTVTIEGKDSDGLTVSRGSKPATVKVGVTSAVTIDLGYLEYYTVSFMNVDGSEIMPSVKAVVGDDFILPGCTVSSGGQIFAGWAVQSGTSLEIIGGEGTVYTPNDNLVLLPKFLTLQDLIDSANEGDTISFSERYTLTSNITINKNINIEGTSSSHVEIDGAGQYHITSATGVLTLKYVDFTNGYGATSGGGMIMKTGGELNIENCTFTGCKNSGRNTGNGDGGAVLAANTKVTITNSNFNGTSNSTEQAESGGLVRISAGCRSVTITGCTFENGYASHGGALSLRESAIVSDCTFRNNRADYAGGAINIGKDTTSLSSPVKPTVQNCTFETNVCDGWLGDDIYTCDAAVISVNNGDIDTYNE